MDVVDEQLDVITKGFLGPDGDLCPLPRPQVRPDPDPDYYALAGILRNAKAMEHANVSKWVEVPLPVDRTAEAQLKEHEAAVAALQARIKTAKGRRAGDRAKGVLAVKDVPGIVVDDAQAKKVGDWQDSTHSGTFIGAGYTHDQNAGKGEKTLTFQPELPATGRYEVRLAYSHGTSRADNVPVTVFSADGEKTMHRGHEEAAADRRPVRVARARTGSRRPGRASSSSRTRAPRATSPPTPSRSSRPTTAAKPGTKAAGGRRCRAAWRPS